MRRLVPVLISCLALSSCAVAQESKTATAAGGESPAATTRLANPAATYCIETGGKYEITTAADGSEAGVCTLADGTKMDAWEHFQAQNN